MFPFFRLLGRTLPSYGILLLLGAVIAGGWCVLRAPRLGVRREDAALCALLTAVFGMVSAKLLYIVTVLPQIFRGGWGRLALAVSGGGFVFYGGVIGGAAAVWGYARRYRLHALPMLDLFAPGAALASAFGRLGCYAVGCCYGIPAPWGTTFQNSPIAPNQVPLIPVQLFESGFCLALGIALALYQRRKRPHGHAAGLYLCSYGVGRFILEFLRGDAVRGFIGPLSTSQVLALFALAAGIALLTRGRARQASQG